MRSVMLSAASYCRAARAMASASPVAASRSRRALRRARRPALGRIGRIRAGTVMRVVGVGERVAEPLADACAQGFARAGRSHRDRCRGRSRGRCRPRSAVVSASATKAGSSFASARMAASAVDQPVVATRRAAGVDRGDVVDQQPHRDRLQRLPAVERIAVMRGEEGKIVGVEIGVELDRRREAAVDRQHRAFGDAGELERVRRLGQHQHAALDAAGGE